MEKIVSYVLLIAALTAAWMFGVESEQLPDSFALRGALPNLDEWRNIRQASASPSARKLVIEL